MCFGVFWLPPCLCVCLCFPISFQFIFTFVLFALVALCFCFDTHFCRTSEFFRCSKASEFFFGFLTCHDERGREAIITQTRSKHTTLLRTGLGFGTMFGLSSMRFCGFVSEPTCLDFVSFLLSALLQFCGLQCCNITNSIKPLWPFVNLLLFFLFYLSVERVTAGGRRSDLCLNVNTLCDFLAVLLIWQFHDNNKQKISSVRPD